MNALQPTKVGVAARADALLTSLLGDTLAPVSAELNRIARVEQEAIARIKQKRADLLAQAKAEEARVETSAFDEAQRACSHARRKLTDALSENQLTERQKHGQVERWRDEQLAAVSAKHDQASAQAQYQWNLARDGVAAWRLTQRAEADVQLQAVEAQCAKSIEESRRAREQAIESAMAKADAEARVNLTRAAEFAARTQEATAVAGELSRRISARELWAFCPRVTASSQPPEFSTQAVAAQALQDLQSLPQGFATVAASDAARGWLVLGMLAAATIAGVLAAILLLVTAYELAALKFVMGLSLGFLPWLLLPWPDATFRKLPLLFRLPGFLCGHAAGPVTPPADDLRRAASLGVALMVALASLLTACINIGGGHSEPAVLAGLFAIVSLACFALRFGHLLHYQWLAIEEPSFTNVTQSVASAFATLSARANEADAQAKAHTQAHDAWTRMTTDRRRAVAESSVGEVIRACEQRIAEAQQACAAAQRAQRARHAAVTEEADRRLKALTKEAAQAASQRQRLHAEESKSVNANACKKFADVATHHRERAAELHQINAVQRQCIAQDMALRQAEELQALAEELKSKLAKLRGAEENARAEADCQRSAYLEVRRERIEAARSALAELHALGGAATAGVGESEWESAARGRATELEVRGGTFLPPIPADAAAAPDLDFRFEIPVLHPFADGQYLHFDCRAVDRAEAVAAMQAVCLRALASLPAGKLRFHFFDPLGLGQSAAPFAALGDVDEQLIGGRIWTEPTHIEQQLAKVTEHMETVLQKYLRNDYPDIRDYDRVAEEVAEPFRLLVIFDYPAGFNEAAVRRLVSIARNGPRCGVHLLLMRNLDQEPMFHGMPDAELSGQQHLLTRQEDRWHWPGTPKDVGFKLTPGFSKAAFDSVICHVTAELRINSLASLAPEKLRRLAGLNGEWWDETTVHGLRAPMGVVGARKVQWFHLGVGTAHHALLVGQPGSGKTNLMHSIITGLVQQYSPEELELYLIDFKGGVGFKQYAAQGLPHARVIAVETEREFGLSILNALQDEMNRRAERFRAVHAEHLAEYRERTGVVMSRILLVTDEFQEFFALEGSDAAQARMIFERIVRMGRAFGIHLLLASQTLSGSAQLGQSTRDNIAVRIVLKATEETARTALCEDNHAARQLNRPGAGIYNDASGLVEGNKPFQAALMSDEQIRKALEQARDQAVVRKLPLGTVVFEGNEAAQLGECKPLLAASVTTAPPTLWLGQPVALKAPTDIRLARQSGRNLLVVTRLEQEGLGVLCSAWLAMLAQQAPSAAVFHVLDLADSAQPWSGFAQQFQIYFPHQFNFLSRRGLASELGQLRAEVEARHRHDQGTAQYPTHYVVLLGVQRARELRADDAMDDSCAADHLLKLLRDGPPFGVHVLAWCDTARNATALFQRRGVREFGVMVAGAMSEDDSRDLLGEAVAGRLQKQHRVIILDDEHPGTYHRVRPYALPEATTWPTFLEQIKTSAHS